MKTALFRNTIATLLITLAMSFAIFCDAQENATDSATLQNAPGAAPEKSDVAAAIDKVNTWTSRIDDLVAGKLGNEHVDLWRIIYFFTVLFCTLIVARGTRFLIESYLAKIASKSETELDDKVCLALGRPVSALFFACGLYLSCIPFFKYFTTENPKIVVGKICLAIGSGAIFWAIYRLVSVIDHILNRFAGETGHKVDDMIVTIISRFLKIVTVVVGFIFIGQNILELNITALLAGAGVASLAVAFAAQDTIANIFGTIMIALDKPFTIGDRIVTNNYDGTVESIGFRSTRIRLLTGHLVTIPNKKLADAEIENIGMRPSIRLLSNITVVYDTSFEKMKRALEILEEIFKGHEGSSPEFPPRIHFNQFNDWALNIQIIAWYAPPDYWKYMQWLQKTNLEILRRFNEEGIEFAFPTNTTYLAYDPKRKLELKIDGNSDSRL